MEYQCFGVLITKTRLFKYIENFTTNNWKFFRFWYFFHISAQNIDYGYSSEPPRRGGSNEYPQSMFLSKNKKNNVHPWKPQFYCIKVRFKEVKIIQLCFPDMCTWSLEGRRRCLIWTFTTSLLIFKSISKFSSTWSPKFSGLRLYTTYKTPFNAIWNNLHNPVRAAFVRCWFCMMVMPLGLGINPMFAGRCISVRRDAGVTLTQHYEWLEINHPEKSGPVFRFGRRTFSGKIHQTYTDGSLMLSFDWKG